MRKSGWEGRKEVPAHPTWWRLGVGAAGAARAQFVLSGPEGVIGPGLVH